MAEADCFRYRRADRSVAELALGELGSRDQAIPELSQEEANQEAATAATTTQHQKKLQMKHFGLMAEW